MLEEAQDDDGMLCCGHDDDMSPRRRSPGRLDLGDGEAVGGARDYKDPESDDNAPDENKGIYFASVDPHTDVPTLSICSY